jgi:autotransporter-associated beta strand protein
MKTTFRILKLLIVLGGTLATTAVFGQTTYTWTGAGDGTNIANAANWSPAGGPPSGVTQDTGQWNGVVPGNLTITCTQTGGFLPGTGFAGQGVNWNLTSSQAGSVTIFSPVDNSQNIGFYNINVASGAGALTLGDNTSHQLNLITRPAGAVHAMVNNSTNPATINPSVWWQAGGGSAYVLDFGGTGNWVINNYLRPGDGGPTTIKLEGPGNLIWSAAGTRDDAPTGPIIINGGTMILKGTNLIPFENPITVPAGNNTIVNNGTSLEFDAPAQSDTIARVISGTGLLKVSNGMLTLSGANTYTGGTIITAGTLALSEPGTIDDTALIDISSGAILDVTARSDQTLMLNNDQTLIGNGGINGNLMTLAGSTVNPGGAGLVGTLNVVGNMTISSGTIVASLNKGLSPSNSIVSVAVTINNSGGTLKLLNFGPNLVIGDRFTIFSRPVGGAAMTIVSPGFTVANNLAVDGSVTVTSVAAPGTGQITATLSGVQLNLSWPAAYTGLNLQVQTNSLTIGLSTNWVTLPGTDAGSSYAAPLNQTNGSVFYRLAPW